MTTISVPGIDGNVYQFDAPEAASGALAQQYADAINAAITDNSYQVIAPSDRPTESTEVCQVDWDILRYKTARLQDISDKATHLLIHDEGSLPYTSVRLKSDQPRELSILSASSADGLYNFSGALGGSLTVLHGFSAIDLTQTTGDWTIAINSSKSKSVDDQRAIGSDLSFILKNSVIRGSSGNENITVSGGKNLVDMGSGVNHVVSQGQDTVYSFGQWTLSTSDSDAPDTHSSPKANVPQDFVTINGGASQFFLGQYATIADAAPVGSLIRVKSNSSIVGGHGSTVIFDNYGASGQVWAAIGDTISAAGNLTVDHGQNLSVSVAGALNFLQGSGDATLSGGNGSTIYGDEGMNIIAKMSGHATFVANQPGTTGDQSFDASASTGNVEYWTGPGKSTFKGGAGDDHFVFGATSQSVTGDTFATVSGGGGSNSFGVLKGHSGGHVTIWDFSQGKGDYFFEYFYNPVDPAQAVKDLLATATISGGNTTLQLDNEMQVTFIGVTNLNASAIHIS